MKVTTFSAETGSAVVVVASEGCPTTIGRIHMGKSDTQILPTQGIHDVGTNGTLRILGMNCSAIPVVLHTHTCNAMHTGPQECILIPGADREPLLTADTNSVHNNKADDKQMKSKRHNEAEHEDAELNVHNWRDEGGVHANFPTLQQVFGHQDRV